MEDFPEIDCAVHLNTRIPFVKELKVHSPLFTPILQFFEQKISSEIGKLDGRIFVLTKNEFIIYRVYAGVTEDVVFMVEIPDTKHRLQIRRYHKLSEVCIVNFQDSLSDPYKTVGGELWGISKPDHSKLLFRLIQELELL